MLNTTPVRPFLDIFNQPASLNEKLSQAHSRLPSDSSAVMIYLRNESVSENPAESKAPSVVATPFNRFLAYILAEQHFRASPQKANPAEKPNPIQIERDIIKIACEQYLFKHRTVYFSSQNTTPLTKETFLNKKMLFLETSANEMTLLQPFWLRDPKATELVSSESKKETIAAGLRKYQKILNEQMLAASIITSNTSLYDHAQLFEARDLLAKFEKEVLPLLSDDTAANETCLRRFLAERDHLNTRTGYTAAPHSIANEFCLGLALSCIDPNEPDENKAFWQVLMPNITGVHGEANQAWPAYGEALLDGDLLAGKPGKLLSYAFLLRASQSTGIFAHWQNITFLDDPKEAAVTAALLKLPAFQDAPSAETWQRVFAFHAAESTHRDFWFNQQAALHPDKNIDSLLTFFQDVNAVLKKFCSADNPGTEYNVDDKAYDAIYPLLASYNLFMLTKAGALFKKLGAQSTVSGENNITSLLNVMDNLLDPNPGKLKKNQDLRSCFNENNKVLSLLLNNSVVCDALRDFYMPRTFRSAPALAYSKTGLPEGIDSLPYPEGLYSRAQAELGHNKAMRELLLTEITNHDPGSAHFQDSLETAYQWIEAEPTETKDKALFNFVYEINDLAKHTVFLARFKSALPMQPTLENYNLAMKMFRLVGDREQVNLVVDGLLQKLADFPISLDTFRSLLRMIDPEQRQPASEALNDRLGTTTQNNAPQLVPVDILKQLPEATRFPLLVFLGKNYLKAYFKSGHDILRILEVLPKAKCRPFLEDLVENLPAFMTGDHCPLILYKLDQKELLPFFKSLTAKSHLHAIVSNLPILAQLLVLLLEAAPFQLIELIEFLGYAHILSLITKHERDTFKEILRFLPEKSRVQFLQSLGAQSLIDREIYTSKTLREIIQLLPKTEYVNFLNSVGQKQLESVIDGWDLSHFLAVLDETERFPFLKGFDNALLKSAMQKGSLAAVLNTLPKADRFPALERLGDDNLKAEIHDTYYFYAVLDTLPEVAQRPFLDRLGDDYLKSLIQNGSHLTRMLLAYPAAEQPQRLKDLITLVDFSDNDKKSIMRDAEQLGFALENLPETMLNPILESLGKRRLKVIIQDEEGFAAVLEKLSDVKRDLFLEKLEDAHLQSTIQNKDALSFVLKKLPEPARFPFLERLGNDFLSKILKHTEDREAIAALLPQEKRNAFVKSLKMADSTRDSEVIAAISSTYRPSGSAAAEPARADENPPEQYTGRLGLKKTHS